MESKARRIKNYVRANGHVPFEEWFTKLKDSSSKARILTRIDRLRFGNFPDCKSVGGGIYELRIHFGPGFRVYFGLVGTEIVLLLGGGDKASQKRDISTCQSYWKEYKNG
jgi:putative addiction module killer protein